jgi:hypothetical protein
MSVYNRKQQKNKLIVSIVLCLAIIGAGVYTVVDSIANRNSLFEDQDFAKAIADVLKIKPSQITQDMLDEYQSFYYFCNIGMKEDYSASYATPVLILGKKEFTEYQLAEAAKAAEQTDTNDTTSDTSSADNTPSDYITVSYNLKKSNDIALFRNLRVLSAFDSNTISQMQTSAYYTSIYSQFYQGVTAINFDNVIKQMKLSDLTSLTQLSHSEEPRSTCCELFGHQEL